MNTKIITSGKRKRAVARAILTEGTGKVTINKKDYHTLQLFDKLKIEEPIRIAEKVLGKIDFDAEIHARGGGEKGQIEEVVPLQSVLNEKLKEIYKTRTNIMGEVSARYQISNLYLQSTIAFGKFVNTNLSLQYEF